MLKYLRIAVTALSLTACVLLIVLWVRSYRGPYALTRLYTSQTVGVGIMSHRGRLTIGWLGFASDPQFTLLDQQFVQERSLLANLSTTSRGLRSSQMIHQKLKIMDIEAQFAVYRAQMVMQMMSQRQTVPHWLLLLFATTLAAAPWIKWRFSLRTLLIATTLVAVGLGAVNYLSG